MRALTVAALLLTVSSAALADQSDAVNKAQAKMHYEAGDRAFRLGEFEKAVREFRASYELSGVPMLLYNVAQTYRQLGDTKQALFFYQQFKATEPTGDARRITEERIAELKIVLEQQQRAQQAPPTGTAPNESKAVPMVTQSPSSPEGSSQLALSRAHEGNTQAAISRRPMWKNPAGWAVTGGGIALGAVAAGMLGIAASEGHQAEQATTQSAFNIHHSADIRDQQMGWTFLGVGAAAVVVGTVVFITRRGR
jgi:tetratricopeptide (TPR) repeat protein